MSFEFQLVQSWLRESSSKSSSNWEKIKKVFTFLMWIYVVKAGVLAILLICHQKTYKPSVLYSPKPTNLLSKIIRTLGCMTLGVEHLVSLAHGLMFYLANAHCLFKFWWRHHLQRVHKEGLYGYFQDPDRECLRLKDKLDGIVDAIIRSHRAYGKIQSGHRLLERMLADNLTTSQSLHNYEISIQEFETISNSRKVWPANRTPRWRAIAITMWFSMNILVMWTSWLVASLVTFLIQRFSFKQLVACNWSPDDLYSLPMRLDYIQMQVYGFFVMQWYSYPISLATTGVVDQFLSLLAIQKRIKTFDERLRLLREISLRFYEHQDCSSNFESEVHPDPRRRLTITNGEKCLKCIKRHAQIKSLKHQCNSEALDLYVLLRLFIDEIQIFLRLTEFLTNWMCTTVYSIQTVLMYFGRHAPEEYFPFLWTLAGGCVLSYNCITFPLALLNYHCIKTTKFGWSILASVEASRWDNYEPTPFSSDTVSPLGERLSSQQLINPHTMYIWRQLITDFESLKSSFSSRILGQVQIDFRLVVKLNFVMASLAALLLNRA